MSDSVSESDPLSFECGGMAFFSMDLFFTGAFTVFFCTDGLAEVLEVATGVLCDFSFRLCRRPLTRLLELDFDFIL